MKVIRIKGVSIGEGLSKIAVSITGDTKENIKEELKKIDLEKIDIVEWRADFFKDILDTDKVISVLKIIRKNLKKIPIIFTFRSKYQGGNKNISLEEYIDLNLEIGRSNIADIIDIELLLDIERMNILIKDIQKEDIFTIASCHDFSETPKKDKMEEILGELDSTADILKLAFMAKSPQDVFRLMDISKAWKKNVEKPMIIISMGKLGKISRILNTNSSISFASLDTESAPGQIPVDTLYETINYNNFKDR